ELASADTLRKSLEWSGLDDAAVTEAEALEREAEPELPASDADVSARHVETFLRLREAQRTMLRALELPVKDARELGRERQRRFAIASTVLAALIATAW